MNDRNHQAATVNEGYLAAAQLNNVPGFDPLKFLHRTGSGNSEEELRLNLRYKKLWFRLAYPKGRMRLIARHITEQMAIFEAQIYLDRSDNEPVGNFTATCTYEQAKDFVKAAQDTALDHALANAGFGVQFEAPEPQAKAKAEVKPPLLKVVPKSAPNAAGGETAQARLTAVCNASMEPEGTTPVPMAGRNEPVSQKEPAAPQYEAAKSQEVTATVTSDTTPVATKTELDHLLIEPVRTAANLTEKTLPLENLMETAIITNQANQEKTVLLSRFTQPSMAAASPAKDKTVQETGLEKELPVAPAQAEAETPPSKYTADMSVEEIVQRMTFEEARNVKVDVGTCNGWTLAQVAERRPPSLKWYVYGYKEDNNILRAAAQIMLDSLSEKKAG